MVTVPKAIDSEVAQVLDFSQADTAGNRIQQQYLKSTPFEFLTLHALADDGTFDLSGIKDQETFNWACVAANQLVRESGVSNVDGMCIKTHSNFKFQEFNKRLHNYKNKEVVNLLQCGFPIEAAESELMPTVYSNHKGAVEFPEQLRTYISKQLSKKTLIGPFKQNPFGEQARFSPLNTVPKKNTSDRRVIMDLSWPKQGESINSRIDKNTYRGKSVKCVLPTVEDLVKIVLKKGKGCKIFRRDMQGAYKQLPVCLGEIHLLGFCFEDQYYFDITLPMGLANSALICQMVSDVIIFIFESEGYDGLNYLDDLGGAEVPPLADQAFEVLGLIMQSLGFQEAMDKALPPTEIGSFLGILFNTILMRLEIVPERLSEIKLELSQWKNRHTSSLREMQSLVGKLSFCASTVRAGRLFFSRILNFMKSLPRSAPFKQCEIDAQVFRDINWWIELMPSFNGISVIPNECWLAPDVLIASDATPKALGGWSQGQYFYAKFPQFILDQQLDINILEALAIMVSLKLWGYKLSGRNAMLYCDNTQAVKAINSGRSGHPFMQAILREICFICATNDTLVRAIWLEGRKNKIPDALSRWFEDIKHRKLFYELTKNVKISQQEITDQMFLFSNTW